MNDPESAALLFASQSNSKSSKVAGSQGPPVIGHTPVYKKPAQRALRRKRQVEDYEHYAAIVFDEDGSCQLLSSPSLKRQKRSILNDAAARAQEVVEGIMDPKRAHDNLAVQAVDHNDQHLPPMPLTGSISFPFDTKRRRVIDENSNFHYRDEQMSVKIEDPANNESTTAKPLLIKTDFDQAWQTRTIKVTDAPAWHAWYLEGFTSIQQTACRTIAKEWIKAIHPKKQSTHPYNGKIPRSEGGSPDPERTRPPYWPPYVRHKEPDHIDKTDRTALLVYLLTHTPQDEIVPDKGQSERSFAAKDLLDALRKKQDEGIITKWPIIEALINVRSTLEDFEGGGIDDSATLLVPDWSAIMRATGSRKKVTDGTQFKHHNDEEVDSVFEDVHAPEDEHRMQNYAIESHRTGVGKLTQNDETQNQQQQQLHSAFPDASTHYSKSLASRVGKSNATFGTTSLVRQHNMSENLASFGYPDWQHEKANKPDEPNDLELALPYTKSQGIIDPTHFTTLQPLTQLPIGHQMINNDSQYGSENNYQYNISQVSNAAYDFRQVDQYHHLGYTPQYDVGRHFDGM